MSLELFSDTLIYRMQRFGGGSVYATELLKRAGGDPDIHLTLIDAEGSDQNRLFQLVRQGADSLVEESVDNLLFQRMTRPKIEGDEECVFHGTYFRTAHGSNVKNVLTVHDFTHQLFYKGIQRFLNNELKRLNIQRADEIICISENTRRDLLRFYPSAADKRIHVIYNGVSDEYSVLPDPESELRFRFPELCAAPYLMYVGSRFEYKNFPFVEKLMEEVPWLSLAVIGGGDLSESEMASLAQFGSRMHKYDGLNTSDLNVLYNNAFALIYPSLYEGFGIPIVEAMRASCPVIAFDNSAITEVMGSSHLLLSNDDLAGAVSALSYLKNVSYRSEIIEQQHELASRFSWDRAYSSTKDVYLAALVGNC